MNETEERLAICFKSTLPELSLADIPKANPDSVPGWDSVTTVTLLAVIEEEFGTIITIEDVGSDFSFQGILTCIKNRQVAG